MTVDPSTNFFTGRGSKYYFILLICLHAGWNCTLLGYNIELL